MADSEVQVKFGADTKEADAGIGEVSDKLKDMGKLPRELLESFGELRKTFIEAFAVHEVAEFVEHIAELGEQAIRSSEMLGIGAEKVQELGFAARMVGGSSEGMVTALTRLERNMSEAQSGAGRAAETFKNLGISLDDLKSKTPDQILGLIADKFKDTQDGANKTAYALALMGRSGAEMIPLLNQGSEGLERMGVIGRQTGSILTDLQSEGLERTAQEITTLKASVEGAGIALFEMAHNSVDVLIVGLTQLVQWITEGVKDFDALKAAIEGGIVLTIAKLGDALAEWEVRAEADIDEVKAAFETLGQVIDDVVHLHFQKAVEDWEAGGRRIVAAERDAAAEIAGIAKQYDDYKEKVLDAVAAVITLNAAQQKKESKPGLPPVPTGQGGQASDDDHGDLDDFRNAQQTRIALAKLAFDQQKEMDDAELAAGKLTQAQKIADLQAYAGLQFQIEGEALEKEKALYSEGEVEYDAVLNRQKILRAQFNLEMLKLDNQLAQAQRKNVSQLAQEYRPVFDAIGRDFDQMLQGVLQGTQTWEQAFEKMWSNIAVSAVEALAKIIAEFAVFEVITRGQGTWGDFMALESAGKAGIGSQIMGSFDVGTWSVPQTGPAMIHQGEIILPPDVSAGVRAGTTSIGGASGGGSFTINISAIDTQSGAQFLKNNAPLIAQQLQTQMRYGNGLRQ